MSPISAEVDFNIEGTTLVIDEFDSIVFEKRYTLLDIFKNFNRAEQIIAFSGSQMQDCHKVFLQSKLNGILLNFVPRT
jgi:hypothetical protein